MKVVSCDLALPKTDSCNFTGQSVTQDRGAPWEESVLLFLSLSFLESLVSFCPEWRLILQRTCLYLSARARGWLITKGYSTKDNPKGSIFARLYQCMEQWP